jgi:hypothetical protein
MFKKFLCKWIGHNWIFLPNSGAHSITLATCERCLHREKLARPDEAPAIQHILSRDQRDALCAANAFLATLQIDKEGKEGSVYFHRVQKAINAISDMLYGTE